MSDPTPPTDEIFRQAVAHHQAGRLAEAEALYRQLLLVCPDHALTQNNLGLALVGQGRLDEAIAHYQRVLVLRPDYAEAHFNLGNAFNERGLVDDAVAAFRRALVFNQDHAGALINLGSALNAQGRLDEAVSVFERTLALNPGFAEGYYNLGNVLSALGRLDEAVIAYQRALTLNPNHAKAYNNLGNALSAQGKADEAVSAYQRVLALTPNNAKAHNNLGKALYDQSNLDEAVEACERALALSPNFAGAHNNLGNAFKDQGRLDEALAHYRRALDLEPGYVAYHLNLLGVILSHPGFDDAARFAEHLRFARMHAPAQGPSRPHPNSPDPHRKLRLGYVSADLRGHTLAHVLIPLIEAHDRANFELFFYVDLRLSDDMTERFRALADSWRIANGLSDAQVADAVRADRIDILICLAGRFDGNRPLVAAYKPAPVQLSFHDPATSGLAAMDYLIADPVLVPRGSKESFVERVVRLPTYWLAQPIDQAPPVVPPPARESGVLTFGCLNNPSKITDDVLKLWGALMGQVPGSRLLLKYKRSYASATLRRRVQEILGRYGVAPERIIMRAENQDLADHLALYGGIDVALDPFPFCGATTTFEALWMGVPVVTLAGEFMVGRWSASMLSALGLPELVAATPAEYIAICRRLAADPKGLAELRAGLRARVAASRLCDAQGRARQIERLYRAMWRRWCNKRAAGKLVMSDPTSPTDEIFQQAVAHHQEGRLAEAEALYRQLLRVRPDHVLTRHVLGLALAGQGRLDEAVAHYQRALDLAPDYAEAHFNLGNAFKEQGKVDEAVAAYRRALIHKPDQRVLLNLGSVLSAQGKLDEAVIAYEQALMENPNFAEAHYNLGNALSALGRLDEAVTAYQRALALKSNHAEAHYNLSSALNAQGKLDEAVDVCERALALNPDYAGVHNNLGGALKDQGRLDEALAHYRRALDLEPGLVACHLNLLAGILCHPGCDDTTRFAEHLRFARMHAPAQVRSSPHPNPPDPNRKLRLGYVSADLRDHPVGRNLIPLVEACDRSNFDLFFYADLRRPDDMTARFRALADGWRVTNGLSDAQVAETIRADRIDILVCLAGRFDDNRPLVAAHRPAPVQVSFLDPATSGLAAMEYLIADPVLVPRRSKESFVERVVRLPTYYLAQPIDQAPPVTPLPALGSGVLTFGCINKPAKITDDVLKLWGALMGQVPGSKLLLKYRRGYASATLRRRVQEILGRYGVAPERIVMLTEDPDSTSHLALYGGIDVALDPFPFCGGITTFEALWMGVPVVTLAGEFMVGRWSASMLSALGLPELVAATPAEYIAICRRLAADPKGLAELRAGLRARVAASRLCDAQGRARQIERLYRAMWRRWCNKRAAGEDL